MSEIQVNGKTIVERKKSSVVTLKILTDDLPVTVYEFDYAEAHKLGHALIVASTVSEIDATPAKQDPSEIANLKADIERMTQDKDTARMLLESREAVLNSILFDVKDYGREMSEGDD